jgi:hypothetical protein
MPSFICPVITCNRHQRAFGRKYNLTQHLKRNHAENPTEPTLVSNSMGAVKGNIVTISNEESSMASEDGQPAIDQEEMLSSRRLDKTSLITKLNELQTLKEKCMAKFDGDIAALERVLSIM